MQIIIGQVALIAHDKKQDFTLQVIYELKKRKYDVIGLFAGEFIEPEFERKVFKLVEQYGLTNDVVFMGHRNDIPDFLKVIDILIIPSAFEGFPLAGIEANSAGIPVLCADQGGSLEYAQVSGGGCVFEYNNVESAANAVITIYKDYKNLTDRGMKFAKLHGITNYAAKIKSLF